MGLVTDIYELLLEMKALEFDKDCITSIGADICEKFGGLTTFGGLLKFFANFKNMHCFGVH